MPLGELVDTSVDWDSNVGGVAVSQTNEVFVAWDYRYNDRDEFKTYLMRATAIVDPLWKSVRTDDTAHRRVGALALLGDSAVVFGGAGSAWAARYTMRGEEVTETIPVQGNVVDAVTIDRHNVIILESLAEPSYQVTAFAFADIGLEVVGAGAACAGGQDCESGRCCFAASSASGECSATSTCDFGKSCSTDADCTGGLCVTSEGYGSFCSSACDESSACPVEAFCSEVICDSASCLQACMPDCASGGDSVCETIAQGLACKRYPNVEGVEVNTCQYQAAELGSCSRNEWCLSGSCLGGVCAPPGGLPGGAPCESDDWCQNGACVRGVCVGTEPEGSSCSENGECESGYCCPKKYAPTQLICGPEGGCEGGIGDRCQANDQCVEGGCAAGDGGWAFCTQSCTTDADCGTNRFGFSNHCVLNMDGQNRCFPGCDTSSFCDTTYSVGTTWTCKSGTNSEGNTVQACTGSTINVGSLRW